MLQREHGEDLSVADLSQHSAHHSVSIGLDCD